MFEDFKDKIHEYSNNSIEKTEQTSLSPEVLEKLKQQGIDPENVTLAQLFPECLDSDGNDLSLMSGAELEIMITYAKTRKYSARFAKRKQKVQAKKRSHNQWLKL